MLTLNDGRNELWQWDTNRKLTVDADCSQVHFSNKVFGRSIDVDVIEGTATIPDVLLQTDKELTAWAFAGTAENGYTKIEKTFKVNRRNKPADYVFTPPEQTTLGQIMKRLDRIEESQDPDAIKNAVDDYLVNNPIQIDETDPTVPAWAKQATKPKYTAAEVGAVATVNGVKPDANGNVQITIPDSGGSVDQSTERYLGDLKRTPIYPCMNIYLDGDTTGMTKDNAVMLNILILDEYGNVKFDGKSKTAWQGSGSLQYPNKNLSLKLRDKNDEESKVKLSVFPEYATSTYHLKCNYADYSMVRNSVGAKMAKGFDDTVFPVDAPMVISSIPAILYLNGEFNGCYTLNTKQDDDLFGMDTKENPLTQIVYRSGLNGWNLSNFEYRSDGTETAETQAKLTRLLNFAKNSDDKTFVRDFENYLSLNNAINYWIFADVACASDNLLNNWTIATWNGNTWYMLWYDLDIIFGLFRNAGLSYHPSKPTTDLLPLQYTTPNPIWAKLYSNFFDEIRERYWELRNNGILTPTAIVNQFRTFQSKWGTEWIQKDRAKWTGRLNKTDDIDMMYGWISDRLAYLDEKYTNKVLTGIAVTYTGGDVAIGTSLNKLTGITVIASYDDGSTATVTGYTLSGEIAEGSNTITVRYEGMTATFTVTGMAESGGEDVPDIAVEVKYGIATINELNDAFVIEEGYLQIEGGN